MANSDYSSGMRSTERMKHLILETFLPQTLPGIPLGCAFISSGWVCFQDILGDQDNLLFD